MDGPNPNTDMLIVKPSLYAYIENDKIKNAIENGISSDDKTIKVYFTRIPEKSEYYQNFVNSYSPVKILISKLKRIKDQMVKINPVNLPKYQNSLTEDDILEIVKNSKFLSSFFHRGEKLENIPHAVISTQTGIIPAFCLKVLTPEKRLVSDDIL